MENNILSQVLGWIGTTLFFYGVYALAIKKMHGFTINILANLMYAIQSILMKNWALLACSIGLALVNLYGINQWKNNN